MDRLINVTEPSRWRPLPVHSVVIITNVALLPLHSVITLLEMSLWRAAPAPYPLAAEGKTPLIPPQISLDLHSGTAVLHCTLSARPDLQFAVDGSTSHSHRTVCQGLLTIPLCLRLSYTSVSFRLGIQPCLCAPLLRSGEISAPSSGNHPHPEGSMGPPGYSCLLGLSEHHFCQPHVSSGKLGCTFRRKQGLILYCQ